MRQINFILKKNLKTWENIEKKKIDIDILHLN